MTSPDSNNMAPASATLLLRYLGKQAGAAGPYQLPDGELVDRFVDLGDQVAFEELLRRHGGMVLGVCRRLLPRRQDAEDVFQATFLTLVRKASSIRTCSAVGSWLHGVARCLACQVRDANARRQRHERLAACTSPADPSAEVTLRDAEAVLHDELVRLPEKYRMPLVLCYLEGLGREEAALRLGWSLATLKRQLGRGRELLRVRLTRRGLAPAAALVTVLVAEGPAPAAVPALLARSTLQAALPVSAGQPATGLISPQVAALVYRGTRVLLPVKLALGVALLLLGAAAGLVLRQIPEARQVVAVAPPAARTDHLGDPLPPGAVARLGTHRLRHPGVVETIVFTKDSRTLITAGDDRTIRLWDRQTGKEVRRLTGHAGVVTALALSPEGKTLASASRDQTVILWDLATGKERRRCTGHQGDVWSVVFSRDGKLVLSGGQDRTVRVWDVRTAREVRRLVGSKGGISSLALSPDGKTLATASSESAGREWLDPAVRLWDVETGKEVRQLTGQDSAVRSLAFSPDGQTLAIATSALDQGGSRVPIIRLWSLLTRKERQRWVIQGSEVRQVAFSPDGKTLAVIVSSMLRTDLAPNFTVRLLDPDTGKETRQLGRCFFRLSCLAFAPDGKTLAAGGSNKVVALWETATGKPLLDEGNHQHSVTSLAFAPGGRILYSASYDTTIRAWDVATGKEIRRLIGHEGLVRCIAVSPDGKLLVSGGGTLSNTREKSLRLWDLATGTERDWAVKDRGLVSAVAFSADGKTAASAGPLLDPLTQRTTGRLIQLWDVQTGKEVAAIPLPAGGGYVMALSPDGKTVAAAGAGKDHAIRLLDTTTRRERGRCTGHQAEVLTLAFSPDGKTLTSAGRDRTIRLWESVTGKERARLLGHQDAVNAVVFSPDGNRLASGGSDQTVRIWEVSTGKEVLKRTGHTSGVKALAFSPGGTRLASGSLDTTILVWEVPRRGVP
jgi:RNA polymerase sigma factor (sigma-70 family)